MNKYAAYAAVLLTISIIVMALVGAAMTPVAPPRVEQFAYAPKPLMCDVGLGPDWGELQQMVHNLR